MIVLSLRARVCLCGLNVLYRLRRFLLLFLLLFFDDDCAVGVVVHVLLLCLFYAL